MSVIHDALRMAGRSLPGRGAAPAERSDGTCPERRRPGMVSPWPVIVPVFLGMLFVGSVTGLALQTGAAGPPGMFEKTGSWLRDAFGGRSGRPLYVVSGIIHGDRSQAILNGELVSVGSRVGNAVVVEIGDKRVVLREGKKEIPLVF